MKVTGVGVAYFAPDGTIIVDEISKPERIVKPIRADSFRGFIVFRYPEDSGVHFGAFSALPGKGGAGFTAGGTKYSFKIERDMQSSTRAYLGTFTAAPVH